jgi:hypothetical protein
MVPDGIEPRYNSHPNQATMNPTEMRSMNCTLQVFDAAKLRLQASAQL